MSSMQAAADARKAKLAALKKRKTLHDSGDAPPVEPSADRQATHSLTHPRTHAPQANQLPVTPRSEKSEVFKFRNYDPSTGTLRKHARTDEQDTVEKQVEGLTEQAIALEAASRKEELDLSNIQPKKANWDLKRDLERKLGKLRGKTESAISTLIRQRLTAEKGEAAAAAMVATAGAGEADAQDSDEESE